ncbi:MAG: 5-formyltetrahydrofolate cyclo-ligase [Oscillochloridaceae bacterium umkhey_bin13]
MDVKVTKADLRRTAKQRRAAMTDRTARSGLIMQRLMGLAAYQQAQAIHCYLAIGSEVDTYPIAAAIFAAGKRLAVPVITPDGQLIHSWLDRLDPPAFGTGTLGTPVPRQLDSALPGSWHLTLVPLLAFDRRGYRLGYGKGYYDGLLAEQQGGVAVGLAFACQEVPAVPVEPHDQPLDLIVTEYELIVC